MKQKNFFLLIVFVFITVASAQTTINVQINGGVFTVANPPVQADFTKPVKIVCVGSPTNFLVQKKTDNISDPSKQADGSFDINVNKPKAKSFKLILTADGAKSFQLEIKNTNVGGGSGGSGSIVKIGSNTKAFSFFEKNISQFSNFYRYDRKANRAYFFFDQNGALIGPAPVNIDADDYIEIFIAVPETELINYSVEVVGDYSPSDLLIRPHEAIATGAAHGTGAEDEKYTYVHQIFGPFTSDRATIKIYGKDDDGEDTMLNQMDTKINKLYNVGIGASFISTQLANPDYEVFPINGTTNNTIRAINDGNRTMVTFNVIYYWKPTIDWITGKLKGSSHITRGRDILKEPDFWERLNPIFGVALSNKWDENFFIGGNFEFARGGSISAGWHYGKVQSLADENFKLGEDVFTGTQEDIKLTNSWQWSTFVGITVDTRIFNALFSHQ